MPPSESNSRDTHTRTRVRTGRYYQKQIDKLQLLRVTVLQYTHTHTICLASPTMSICYMSTMLCCAGEWVHDSWK